MHLATVVLLLACLATVCCVPVTNKRSKHGHAAAPAARLGPQARGFADQLTIKAYLNGDGKDDDADDVDGSSSDDSKASDDSSSEEAEEGDEKRLARGIDLRAPKFNDILEIKAELNGEKDDKKDDGEAENEAGDRKRMARGTAARRKFADILDVVAKLNGDGEDSGDSDKEPKNNGQKAGNRKPAEDRKKPTGEERTARLDNATR